MSSPSADVEPLAVSPAVARRLLGVSHPHLYAHILPKLETYNEGRARRITMKSIRDYIARCVAENPANPQKPRRGRPKKAVQAVTTQPEAST
jgi:hypothetical protein